MGVPRILVARRDPDNAARGCAPPGRLR